MFDPISHEYRVASFGFLSWWGWSNQSSCIDEGTSMYYCLKVNGTNVIVPLKHLNLCSSIIGWNIRDISSLVWTNLNFEKKINKCLKSHGHHKKLGLRGRQNCIKTSGMWKKVRFCVDRQNVSLLNHKFKTFRAIRNCNFALGNFSILLKLWKKRKVSESSWN